MIFRSLFIVFFCVSIASCGKKQSKEKGKQCNIRMNEDLPPAPRQPVFTNPAKTASSTSSTVLPTVKDNKGLISVNDEDSLRLSCPGKGNHLVFNNKQVIQISCSNGNFKVTHTSEKGSSSSSGSSNRREIPVVDASAAAAPSAQQNDPAFDEKNNLKCALPVKAEVRLTTSRCAAIGKVYDVGFDTNEWYITLSVCHDPTTTNTFYSRHLLFGAALQGAQKEDARPQFEEGNLEDLFPEVRPNDAYDVNNQRKVFNQLFGANAKKYYNEDEELYLVRGLLAPASDFIFGNEQFSTYFYVNVAPQWQTINNGNWLLLENMVRQYAINTKKELTIVTGTFDVLALENDEGEKSNIYLNEVGGRKLVAVPKYHWKVVYDERTTAGIAFLTSNNPFLSDGTKLKFCNRPCEGYGFSWLNSKEEFVKGKKGITSCCPVNELRKIILPTHVPFLNINQNLNTLTFNTNRYIKTAE